MKRHPLRDNIPTKRCTLQTPEANKRWTKGLTAAIAYAKAQQAKQAGQGTKEGIGELGAQPVVIAPARASNGPAGDPARNAPGEAGESVVTEPQSQCSMAYKGAL